MSPASPRSADLLIAAKANANGLDLHMRNSDDVSGLPNASTQKDLMPRRSQQTDSAWNPIPLRSWS